MMAANKRKQDDKHLKMLREMVSLSHNKQCFDCGQRGPTYVNMTIGSYVCTSCSGVLRGLNPPHRVKSISMTSFSADDMEFLLTHGNEFSKKVWLGLYDARSQPTLDSRDEQKLKDFLANKYEKKRWYVAPTDSMTEEARQMNTVKKAPDTKPMRSMGGASISKFVVGHQQSTTKASPPSMRPPAGAIPTPLAQAKQNAVEAQPPKTSGAMDLLGDLGGDPFSSPSQPAAPATSGGFADFGNFSQTPSAQPASTGGFLQPQNQQTDLFAGFSSPQTNTVAAPPAADKYSNLSDLFSLPTPEPTPTVGWDGSPAGGSGGSVGWGGGSGNTPGGSVFGSSAPVSSAIGTSSTMFGGAQTNTSLFGSSGTEQSHSWESSNPTNPFAQSQAANPFGQAPMSQPATSANPFLGGGGGGGFQQPAFSQFPGATQPMSNAGFGQFNTTSTGSSSGLGQFGTNTSLTTAGMQNGSWGGQGQGQNQTGLFGGSGQMIGKPAQTGFGAPQPVSQSGFGAPQPVSQSGFGAPQPVSQSGFGAPQPVSQAGFGAPQPAGFGAPQSVGQGFGSQGGFGGPPPSQGGFGAPQQSQPGFGAPQQSQQGFGAPQQGFGAAFGSQQPSQQPFGTWGQPRPAGQPSANPFMNVASQQAAPPSSSSTNPFL